MSALSVKNLHIAYQQQTVIANLNLTIEQGEIVALFGPSGGGKSTILKAIAGLLDQVSGEIAIGDKVVLSETVNLAAEKRHTGLIFQDYALFPHLTVAENIAFGLNQLTKAEQVSKVEKMLTLIKMLEYKDKYPHQLSGGQQQRIAIVRALACEPKILLFDEAFSNIDPQFRFELIADIRDLLKTQGISVLFVTHNQDEAFAFCDRIAVLNQGKIEQIDQAERLFNYPASRFVAEFLGEGLWLSAKVESEVQLSSELGLITYCGDTNITHLIGTKVDVYLRPHHLKLSPSTQTDLYVDHERFVGEFYQSDLTWSGQKIKVKSRQSFLNKPVEIQVDTQISTVFESSH
ncbi:ABC transporter ATP-binding protein [Catenovulum maritimum]|uniref:Iron ABC transporter ATPase n=1 Tax=Catenovulum maritimum TaxID=1513271 RepID=A0A0J8GML0_9ALTE|nr:ABC transporter ATP-binding protein [Catenovulum maritimum]KMT64007.1 iron ABC transporter ATPase [Catenovulum maritimum]